MSGTVARKIDARGTNGRCTQQRIVMCFRSHCRQCIRHHFLANQRRRGLAMSNFDLVVRNARVATASDTFDADIGIVGGRIVQLGQGLPAGEREIDAAGRVVTPGGVDAHCHLDQPMAPPARMADDFDSGTRARRLRRHHHGDSVRGAGEGPVAARRGGRLSPPRRRQGACRLRLPPDRQRPDAAGAERGTAGADPRGLHVVQDLHDLRRPEARRRPDPRRAGGGARSTARWR